MGDVPPLPAGLRAMGGKPGVLPASPRPGSAPPVPAQPWHRRIRRKRGAWGCAGHCLSHPRSGQPTALVEIASSQPVLFSNVFSLLVYSVVGIGGREEGEAENLPDANYLVFLSFQKPKVWEKADNPLDNWLFLFSSTNPDFGIQ